MRYKITKRPPFSDHSSWFLIKLDFCPKGYDITPDHLINLALYSLLLMPPPNITLSEWEFVRTRRIEVLTNRYSLAGNDVLTFKELAKIYGVSRGMISLVEFTAFRVMRKNLLKLLPPIPLAPLPSL